MDARWYQPKLGRWLQPDYYNFAQLSLPTGARQQLLASTSLNTQGLLRDPAQQMRYGYTVGNFYRWTDPLGLATYFIGGALDKGDIYTNIATPTNNIERTRLRAEKGQYGKELEQLAKEGKYVGYEEYEKIVEEIQNLPKDEVVNMVGHSRGGGSTIRLTQDERLADRQFGTVITLDPVKESYDSDHYYELGPNVENGVNIHTKQSLADVIADVPAFGTVTAATMSSVAAMVSKNIDSTDVIATTGGQLGAVKGMTNQVTNANHWNSSQMLDEASKKLTCPSP